MAGIDFIYQNNTKYEIVPEIAPLFETTKAYAIGDHVIYEAEWYTFKEAKTAGAWDATKVDGPFKVTNQISELKEDLIPIRSGEDVLVEYGYFTDAMKQIDSVVGFDTVKFDSVNQILNGSDVHSSGVNGIVGVGFSDFGLTDQNALVDIDTYPILIYSIDSDISDSVNIRLYIWSYTSNMAYHNDYYITNDRTGQIKTLNLKKWIRETLGYSASYKNVFVRQIASESFTSDSAKYLKFKLYGFFTEEQAKGLNLKEKMENLTEAVADLSTDVASVQNIPYEIGEKCATGAPLALKSVAGTLNANGTFSNTSTMKSTVTNKIKCAEGDVFDYFGQSADSVVTCMWFKADGTILSSEKVGAGSYAHQTFTAPANADSVIFTSYGNNSASYMHPLVVTQKTTYESPLSKKVWYPCGDSFTAGDFTGISDSTFASGKYAGKNKTYPYHIGNRTNIDVRRASTSGETMATYSGGSVVFSDPSYTYGYKSVGTDADIITIWFGINDSGKSIPIGTIDDDDNTTFYGAWNVVLDDLTTRCTKAHIGIIVSNNLTQTYVDAIIAIAKKWGLPYLDLNYDNNVPLMHYSLRPDASAEIKAKRNSQFAINAGTNNHPNLLAHEYESYFIEEWLKTL